MRGRGRAVPKTFPKDKAGATRWESGKVTKRGRSKKEAQVLLQDGQEGTLGADTEDTEATLYFHFTQYTYRGRSIHAYE